MKNNNKNNTSKKQINTKYKKNNRNNRYYRKNKNNKRNKKNRVKNMRNFKNCKNKKTKEPTTKIKISDSNNNNQNIETKNNDLDNKNNDIIETKKTVDNNDNNNMENYISNNLFNLGFKCLEELTKPMPQKEIVIFYENLKKKLIQISNTYAEYYNKEKTKQGYNYIKKLKLEKIKKNKIDSVCDIIDSIDENISNEKLSLFYPSSQFNTSEFFNKFNQNKKNQLNLLNFDEFNIKKFISIEKKNKNTYDDLLLIYNFNKTEENPNNKPKKQNYNNSAHNRFYNNRFYIFNPICSQIHYNSSINTCEYYKHKKIEFVNQHNVKNKYQSQSILCRSNLCLAKCFHCHTGLMHIIVVGTCIFVPHNNNIDCQNCKRPIISKDGSFRIKNL